MITHLLLVLFELFHFIGKSCVQICDVIIRMLYGSLNKAVN